MVERNDEATNSDVEISRARMISAFEQEFLANDAVAIIIKQHLLPDDVDDPVVFPPTYLRAKDKTTNNGEENDNESQKSVYNIDDLGDGRNVCEIDSPQSDGNRSEPLFKSDELKRLVPQIVIDVNGVPCNLLDAGHRAADAVVRFSSLAAEFHWAFTRAATGDHSHLATLAPTSILYGVWDSRSTQTKLQRIIKASVRAFNVRKQTKSATYNPAVNYVHVGAIKEELDKGEGESNPLSSEGMKHALASQTHGGVRLTDSKSMYRKIKINLVGLRQLRAIVSAVRQGDSELQEPSDKTRDIEKTRTDTLRKYILGLALVSATSAPDLNLREGCNLRLNGVDEWLLVKHRKDDEPINVDRDAVIAFADNWGKNFFESMGLSYENKDHLDATFEKDVAEEFLGLSDAKGSPSVKERDKVRALGPITKETLAKYRATKKNREPGSPIERLRKRVDSLSFTKSRTFKKPPREELSALLKEFENDGEASDNLKSLVEKIRELLTDEGDANARKEQMLKLFSMAPEQLTRQAEQTPANGEKE